MFHDMFQLYLVTVLTNVLAGLALAGSYLSTRFDRFAVFNDFMENSVYRVILGIVSLLAALINFFPNFEGDIAFIGNLLPSLSGLICGIILLSEFINQRRDEGEMRSSDIAEKVERVSAPYQTAVGIVAVFVGILHAFLPRLPLF